MREGEEMKKAKRFIVGGLIIAAALTIIVGFSSYVVRVTQGVFDDDYLGQIYVPVNHKVLGWNMLGFNPDSWIFSEDFLWAKILGGGICWFALLTALLTVIFGGLIMAKNSKKFRLIMLIVSVVLQMLQSLLYMIFGVAVTASVKGYGWVCYTTAFIPFILVTLFNAAAFVFNFVLRDEEKNTALSDAGQE